MEESNLIADFKPVKKYFSRIGISCSLLMLVTVVIQYLAVWIIQLAAPEFTESDWFIWIATSLPLYIFAFPIFLYTLPKPIDKPMIQDKISVKEFFIFLLMCFGVMYPLNFLGYGLTEALKGIFHITAPNPLESAVSGSNIYVTFIFAVLFAPVMEELIFRKLLIDRIGRIDKRTALFFSALAFGLFHGNFYQFFYAYGLGLLLGFIYIKTGRLRYSIGLHMLINFFGTVISQTVLKYANTDALLNTAADQVDILNNMLAALPSLMVISVYGLVLLAMVTAGIYLLIRERRRFRVAEPDDAIPDERAFSIVYMTWGVAAFILICAVMFVLNLVTPA